MDQQDKTHWEQELHQIISGLEEPYRQPLLEIIRAYVRAVEIKKSEEQERDSHRIPAEEKKKAVERMKELRKEIVLPEDFDPDRELAEAILERRSPMHKVKEVTALPEFRLRVQFEEGTIKEYDIKPLFSKIGSFRWLEQNPEAFASVTVDAGGRGIIWNDNLDLSSDELWEHVVDYDDMISARTLAEMDQAMESYKRGIVSEPLILPEELEEEESSGEEDGETSPAL